MYTKVGEHVFKVYSNLPMVSNFFEKNFKKENTYTSKPDIEIVIEGGYGAPFFDYNVSITKDSGKVVFRRADYLIEANQDYKTVRIFVHDELALKHALTNLYSSFIVQHNWGLLIHSSCAIEHGKAHIFSGQSGAGKSTVAKLSQPRDLLSDEATLVKITSDAITVFDSPFRSEITAKGPKESAPLASIQILHQALQNKRANLKKADALLHLMDKVFYWAHSPEETKQILGLLKFLVDSVPVYELHFKKDPTFWELIS